jgi:hypothetical protein
MSAWWSSLSGFEQVFWTLALVSSVLFVIQSFITLIAGTDHHDGDASMDHDHGDWGLGGLFTVRNMIAFFLGLSWSGLGFYSIGLGPLFSIIPGIVVGLGFMLAVMFIMRGLSRLQSSGTVDLGRAVGQEGTVAIGVPGRMSGRGKVDVVLQDRIFDLEAMTKGEAIKHGAVVWVVEVMDNGVLLVKEVESARGDPLLAGGE